MRSLEKIGIALILGLLVSACVKTSYRQTPDGPAVGQTMNAFWSALRAEDQVALRRQLTADATFSKVVERGPGVEVGLSEVLQRQADRVWLLAAEKAPLSNFKQPTPQIALLDTHLEVLSRDDLQRVRITWELIQDGDAWRLSQVQLRLWRFPKPIQGGGL